MKLKQLEDERARCAHSNAINQAVSALQSASWRWMHAAIGAKDANDDGAHKVSGPEDISLKTEEGLAASVELQRQLDVARFLSVGAVGTLFARDVRRRRPSDSMLTARFCFFFFCVYSFPT